MRPPPLKTFGLRLHHDGRFTHEGQPLRHRKLREHFERNVQYVPSEKKFVVTLRHFRAQLEVEEAGFFVREVELARGRLRLSDGSVETLDPATLHFSSRDGALLCFVKRALKAPRGLLARFMPSAHAELLLALEERDGNLLLYWAGTWVQVPTLK